MDALSYSVLDIPLNNLISLALGVGNNSIFNNASNGDVAGTAIGMRDADTKAMQNVVTNGVSSNILLFDSSVIDPADRVESEFKVAYTDANGQDKTFVFTLLPAIESNVRSNNQGAVVPELKPGLLMKTGLTIKKFAVAGASPAFQTLGIDHTMMQLVGAFIGNEGVQAPNSSQGRGFISAGDILGRDNNTQPLDAYRSALVFDVEVVQCGRPVFLTIKVDNSDIVSTATHIQYTVLIQNFRYFLTRNDRVYYALELLVLDYALLQANNVISLSSSRNIGVRKNSTSVTTPPTTSSEPTTGAKAGTILLPRTPPQPTRTPAPVPSTPRILPNPPTGNNNIG